MAKLLESMTLQAATGKNGNFSKSQYMHSFIPIQSQISIEYSQSFNQDGSYSFMVQQTKKCLQEGINGKIVQWDCDGTDKSQQWKVIENPCGERQQTCTSIIFSKSLKNVIIDLQLPNSRADVFNSKTLQLGSVQSFQIIATLIGPKQFRTHAPATTITTTGF